jgi:lincosamide nucleotidyltransferase A/C/D/E
VSSVDAADALEVIRTLKGSGVPSWVAGGWGVDALIGRQTRDHLDLDLAIPADLDDVAISMLGSLGYELAVDQRPARFELRTGDGRSVDFHPVTFGPNGGGIQAGFSGARFEYPADGFTSGVIDGVTVGCLSPERQIAFHLGYEPKAIDRQDMAALSRHLGVALPAPYESG